MDFFKSRILQNLLIFLNMTVFAAVVVRAYHIRELSVALVAIMAFLPVAMTAFLSVAIREKYQRARWAAIAVILIVINYTIWRYTGESTIGDSLADVNHALTFGQEVTVEMFMPLLRMLIMGGSLLLAVTVTIFPYNLIIVDTGLIFFLWAVDYYNQAADYVKMFVPVWVLSILLYRGTFLDETAKSLKVNKKARLFQILAISLVVATGMSFVDLDKKGLYTDRLWTYFNNMLVPTLYINGQEIESPFTIASSGYNDSDTKLGGDVSINDSESLRAKGDNPVYLRGSVKSRYTGTSWLVAEMGYTAGGRVEDYRLSVLNSITSSYAEAIKNIEIYPLSDMTSTLFNTLNTRELYFNNSIQRVFYNGDFQIYTANKESSESYTVEYYYEPVIRQELISKDFGPSVRSRNLRYLELPSYYSAESERVRSLALNVAGTAKSNYEKAVALTDYLKTQYSYTLTPGTYDPGSDFVEEFLFSETGGYCVHYASALAIMLRINGVPARYVEGFKISGEKASDGSYVIRNSDAHAWTEVLIDEDRDLWMTFDATGTVREQGEIDEPGEGPVDPATPGGEDPGEGTVTPGTPGGRPEVDPEEPIPGPIPVKETFGSMLARLFSYAAIAMAVILALMVLRKLIIVEMAMWSKSLKRYFSLINGALEEAYEVRKKGETDLEFANRLHDSGIKERYLILVGEAYKEVYGGEEGEFPERRELYRDISRRAMRLRGLPRHIFRRYVI
ncbi:transglutaminase-like domain-containing protein [Youngiibacter multivorans]|uniref:Transglutaminase-like putative cysteine protease n=1 Tax=Youngiibacter multivorans TaxID=937251 RepID=A0ABS4G5E2_9CLOT|nr:transglutaminase domain-containing protein [Youngiibacter multivorans]MBP1919759.1 transglutaminase-like putative cysteine protease [Youngiibacter multivorans]